MRIRTYVYVYTEIIEGYARRTRMHLCWVGFRSLPRSRKLFSGFDCSEKRLIYYVSYYVKVRVWGLFGARSI